jgi:hypothetical protein
MAAAHHPHIHIQLESNVSVTLARLFNVAPLLLLLLHRQAAPVGRD